MTAQKDRAVKAGQAVPSMCCNPAALIAGQSTSTSSVTFSCVLRDTPVPLAELTTVSLAKEEMVFSRLQHRSLRYHNVRPRV